MAGILIAAKTKPADQRWIFFAIFNVAREGRLTVLIRQQLLWVSAEVWAWLRKEAQASRTSVGMVRRLARAANAIRSAET